LFVRKGGFREVNGSIQTTLTPIFCLPFAQDCATATLLLSLYRNNCDSQQQATPHVISGISTPPDSPRSSSPSESLNAADSNRIISASLNEVLQGEEGGGEERSDEERGKARRGAKRGEGRGGSLS